jgi:peptidoglycan L-alanyl-D-glutamate endopeptidase CwlK
MQALAIKHIVLCAANNIDLLIYCTYRSAEEQNTAYACGRTTAGKIITNCKGGQSKHNRTTATGAPCADAYDCVPLLQGKPQWADSKLYLQVGTLGESIGLKWAGRWVGSLKETAHFEI